ncbi:MAG TPA: GNAT family N-acetyltransferase [Gammaproteobacteria bacterium]
MKFECYSNWDQLPYSANALFEQGENGSIFFSRPWFANLAAALDDDQTMLLACVVDGNKVLVILPLMKCDGSTWYSLKHRYTTHYSLLLADEDQQQVLACLVQGLSQLPFKALLLEPVADNDSRIYDLQQSMETAGYHCERLFRLYNWIYRVQGQSYKEYMAARPAWLRNTISRKKRKLDREHGFEIRLFTGDEVPQAMSDYYAVYTASWKANEQYVDFLDGIVAGFSRPGWSRLAVLYVNEEHVNGEHVKGQPVAAQLWFVLRGKASIFRLAYDKAWKLYSPGSILTGFLMEYVIDIDKVEEIDFLTGNEAYKQDWMSDRRERFALSCVKSGKPAGKYEQFVESLRRIWKRR